MRRHRVPQHEVHKVQDHRAEEADVDPLEHVVRLVRVLLGPANLLALGALARGGAKEDGRDGGEEGEGEGRELK